MYLPRYTVTVANGSALRTVIVTATNKHRAKLKVELAEGEVVASVVKTNGGA